MRSDAQEVWAQDEEPGDTTHLRTDCDSQEDSYSGVMHFSSHRVQAC